MRYCGREFTEKELDIIARLIATGVNRQKLARMFCEETNWRKPDGALKEMSCKVAFLRMYRDGHIVLPPPTKPANNHLKKPKSTLFTSPGPEVINNARFLILPWVRSKNLASRILSLIAKRIASDWYEQYHYEPVLLETFVEKKRFTGTCYKASNWTCVGDTKGRGKLDIHNEFKLPVKSIWLYPLRKDFQEWLRN